MKIKDRKRQINVFCCVLLPTEQALLGTGTENPKVTFFETVLRVN